MSKIETMKYIVLVVLLLLGACSKSVEKLTVIDKGIIDDQWHYINTTFDLNIALPKDWRIVISGKPDCKVGVKECLPMYQLQETVKVESLQEQEPLGKGITLLTAADISAGSEDEIPQIVSKLEVLTVQSEIEDEQAFLEDMNAKLMEAAAGENPLKIEYSKVKLGKESYTRGKLDLNLEDQPTMYFIVKTKGDFKLIISVNCDTEEEFQKIATGLGSSK